MKIVFLASGGGGHLKYFHQSIHVLNLPITIAGVIADRLCGALDYAAQNNIPAIQIHYSKNSPKQLREALSRIQPDLIITNIYKIIDPETLSLYPGRFINLHYSLLPAFGGLIGMKTLEAAKKLNAGFIGASCHYVVDEVDAGPIISQACFKADWQKPMAELMEVTFRAACIILVDSVIKVLKIKAEPKLNTAISVKNTQVQFNSPPAFDVEKLFVGLWPNNS